MSPKLNYDPKHSLDELTHTYQKLRMRYKDKAQSSVFVVKKGYSRLVCYTSRVYGLHWHEFKKQAGYDDHVVAGKHKKMPVKKLILEYKSIRKKHGEQARSSGWIQKKYHWLYLQVNRLGIPWHEFKNQAGYNDPSYRKRLPLAELVEHYQKVRAKYEEADNINWLQENGYGYIYSQVCTTDSFNWHEFKKLAGYNDPITVRTPLRPLKVLKGEYRKLRKKHGDDAKTITWMNQNEHGWIPRQAKKHYGLEWMEFKKKCGYKDVPTQRKKQTLPQLTAEYKKLRRKHGAKTKPAKWLKANGHGWLTQQVHRFYKLSWHEFKKQAGFNDAPYQRAPSTFEILKSEYRAIRKKHGDKASSTDYLREKGYGYLYQAVKKMGYKWAQFKKIAGYNDVPYHRYGLSLEDLITEYRDLREKEGDEAAGSKWLEKNGYRWLLQQMRNKYKIGWHEFKKKAGYEDPTFRGARGVGVIVRRPIHSYEELIAEYKRVRCKHGKKTQSSVWMREHGYAWIEQHVHKRKKIWWDFKKDAGFDDPVVSHPSLSKKKLIQAYKTLVKKEGEKALYCNWLFKNGYTWLYNQARNHFESWNKFKVETQVATDALRRKSHTVEELIQEYQRLRRKHGKRLSSSSEMLREGYGWILKQAAERGLKWNQFRKKAGFNDTFAKKIGMSFEMIVEEYQKILAKHGTVATSRKWMLDNGYFHIYDRCRINRGLKMSWPDFVALCSADYRLTEDMLKC